MFEQLTILALLVIPITAEARSSLFENLLPRGKYPVGFKSTWQFDYSRQYNMTFEDKSTYAPAKAPRPILINIWYPAVRVKDAKPMPYRDYLSIMSNDPRLTKYSTELARYEHNIIAREIMGKAVKDLSDLQKSWIEEIYTTPTACLRDATAAEGVFPLVIYHAGAGSSYEDNSVFCEFLASHGFVVLGSAFPDIEGQSFNTDNREGSARDIDFLIAYARLMSNVDWQHIGLIGHSAGAQASLMYRSHMNTPIDAVVSLDTTQDYHSTSDPLWSFTSEVLKNGKNFNCPLLMAAGPLAFFELADTLSHAERYYLTIKDMDHNDYITQGHLQRVMQCRLLANEPAKLAKEKAALEKSKEGYQTLCLYVLRFFEAELKNDAAAKSYLAKQYRDTRAGDGRPHVDHMPVGSTTPPRYLIESGISPTPRQLRPLIREQGTQKTIEVMRRFRKEAASLPIFTENFAFFLVTDLVDQGKASEATAFRDYFKETGLDCGKFMLDIAKGYHGMGHSKGASLFYKRVLILDPNNTEATAKLKEITEGKK